MKQKWPADSVERVALADLVPSATNARTHTEEQVAQIAASMREWGWTNPVLVDEQNNIIAGHGRVLAARKLGLEQIPAMIARGWSEPQKRAYVLADNQLTLNAGWDFDMLSAELAALSGWDFDLELLGFDNLEQLMVDKSGGLTDPDAIPEVDEPTAKLGDVWRLGRHTLVCGDCTDVNTVARCLGEVKPHLMVTDPPYGVEYDADWRNRADRANGKPYGASAVGVVENDSRADWREAWALFPGDVAYVWHADRQAAVVQASLEANGFEIRCQLIWAKDRLVLSRGDYHWQHEPCWYAVRKTGKGHWAGGRKQSTVWEIANRAAMGGKKDDSVTNHSTQKPVECMKRPIENNSSPGQAVYDPFVGSGTTIIAAEMMGRVCHAIELNPAYVDVCVKRWEDFTGEEAVRDG